MRKKRMSFTEEQKLAAMRLAKELDNTEEAARQLEISSSALGRWVQQAKIDAGKGGSEEYTTAEKDEIRKLRRQLKRTEMERDFLKKAAAFVAKENDPLSS